MQNKNIGTRFEYLQVNIFLTSDRNFFEMGVYGLQSYIEQKCPNAVVEVDIRELAEKAKQSMPGIINRNKVSSWELFDDFVNSFILNV